MVLYIDINGRIGGEKGKERRRESMWMSMGVEAERFQSLSLQ